MVIWYALYKHLWPQHPISVTRGSSVEDLLTGKYSSCYNTEGNTEKCYKIARWPTRQTLPFRRTAFLIGAVETRVKRGRVIYSNLSAA